MSAKTSYLTATSLHICDASFSPVWIYDAVREHVVDAGLPLSHGGLNEQAPGPNEDRSVPTALLSELGCPASAICAWGTDAGEMKRWERWGGGWSAGQNEWWFFCCCVQTKQKEKLSTIYVKCQNTWEWPLCMQLSTLRVSLGHQFAFTGWAEQQCSFSEWPLLWRIEKKITFLLAF